MAQRGTSATTPGDEFLTTDRIRYDRSGLAENTTQAQVMELMQLNSQNFLVKLLIKPLF